MSADPIAALRAALSAYDAAQLGELNMTAEALYRCARACGWPGGKDCPAAKWSRDYLDKVDAAGVTSLRPRRMRPPPETPPDGPIRSDRE